MLVGWCEREIAVHTRGGTPEKTRVVPHTHTHTHIDSTQTREAAEMRAAQHRHITHVYTSIYCMIVLCGVRQPHRFGNDSEWMH